MGRGQIDTVQNRPASLLPSPLLDYTIGEVPNSVLGEIEKNIVMEET